MENGANRSGESEKQVAICCLLSNTEDQLLDPYGGPVWAAGCPSIDEEAFQVAGLAFRDVGRASCSNRNAILSLPENFCLEY